MTEYYVFINASSYPTQGYKLDAKAFPKDKRKLIINSKETNFWDTLPPTIIDHVRVQAKNKQQALALGLMELYKKAKKTP